MMKTRTKVIANFERTKAFIAFIPMMATKMGIKAFIFNLRSNKTGNNNFFFNKSPRAVNKLSMQINYYLLSITTGIRQFTFFSWQFKVQTTISTITDNCAAKNGFW